MKTNRLHITNGTHLTNYLKELDVEGTFLTWQEMLCEGPTPVQIDSQRFLEIRKDFLKSVYAVDINEVEIKNELAILDKPDTFSEIVLWFEYDLFCHINLIGVIKLLQQKQINLPIYLVCSGRIEGETNLKSLTELTSNQLLNHFENKIKLLDSDLDLARTIWHIYCGKDHNMLKPYILKKSSFIYLNSCLRAHLERFPNLKSGLSVLEKNILSIIRDNNVKSRGHLVGYALIFQGYYGYSDMQFRYIINTLSLFFDERENSIKLNRKGHEALIGLHNFAAEINNNMIFGGLNRLDYFYSSKQNKLIKN